MRLTLLFGVLAGALVIIGFSMHLNVVRGLIGITIGGAVGLVVAMAARRINATSAVTKSGGAPSPSRKRGSPLKDKAEGLTSDRPE